LSGVETGVLFAAAIVGIGIVELAGETVQREERHGVSGASEIAEAGENSGDCGQRKL
jgi:hypothetical protein